MRGRIIRWILPLAVVGVVGAGVAMAATAATQSSTTVKAVQNAQFGTILAAANGKTLYRYTVDAKNVNRCSSVAQCAKYWPALLVKPGAKVTGTGVNAALLGTIKAAHGMRQVTYAGWPLYFFAGDKGAGQVNGEDFEKSWYAVNTKGALVKHAVEQSTSSSSSGSSGSSGSTGGTTTTDSYAWG